MSKQSATIRVTSLKLAVPLRADMLPPDLVPPDGPAGEPTLIVELEGTEFKAVAKLNGKNLKLIAEHGPEAVAVILQGTLRSSAAAGGPFVLEGAGLLVNVKTPRPSPETAQ